MNPNSHPTPRAEQRLKLGDQIGKGGFGTVYHGHLVSQSGLRRQVAVKILGDVDPRSQALQRLRDEGRILATLQHAAILRVHDLVLVEDRVALVTEYIPGVDLSRCVRWEHPKPSVRASLEVCGRVAEALHAAHNATLDGNPLDLVHRDVKPANIRITPDGAVKLLDFGIAKTRAPGREAKTELNIMLGSMRYLAPEVVAFDVENGGPPADICALGYTLFEALAGKTFQGGLSHRQQQAIALSRRKYSAWLTRRWAALPDEVPRSVFGLLHSMLDRSPEKRPNALEIADRCFEIAEELPDSLRSWCRSVPWDVYNVGKPGPMSGQTMEIQVLTDERPRSTAEVVESLAPPKVVKRPILAGHLDPVEHAEAATELLGGHRGQDDDATIWGGALSPDEIAAADREPATEMYEEDLPQPFALPHSLAAKMQEAMANPVSGPDTLTQLEGPAPVLLERPSPIAPPRRDPGMQVYQGGRSAPAPAPRRQPPPPQAPPPRAPEPVQAHPEPQAEVHPEPRIRTVLPATPPVAETPMGRALLETGRPGGPGHTPAPHALRRTPSNRSATLALIAGMFAAAGAGYVFYTVVLAPPAPAAATPVVLPMQAPATP